MTGRVALLSPDALFADPDIHAGTGRVVIAYSGGLDSHVLLHLLHEFSARHPSLPAPVAVHINHGLNPLAGIWAEHCRTVCTQMKIGFKPVELDARAPKGESQESWARKLRYAALMQEVRPDDVLMTAHHRDDMAETLLIQLLRGAGPAGLAAMPVKVRIGEGWHVRPLLQYSRTDLLAYAKQHDLRWIEDDSNADSRYDRNLLRNTILPALKQRWPSLATTLYRVARLQAETATLLDDLAVIDMQTCALNGGRELSVSKLLMLSRPHAANALRYWIRQRGFPVPNERQLDEIFTSVLGAAMEASPCTGWSGTQLRRYRDCLFVTAPLPDPPDARIDWNVTVPCDLPLGMLKAFHGCGNGIRSDRLPDNQISVRFRRGDERIRLAGHHHELRKLFQQYGIAPCYRDYVPLLYAGDTLVAIPDLAIADDWQATGTQPGWKISWTELPLTRPGCTVADPVIV